ncbi:MAG: hypothetical protein ACI9OJ_003104, partial [Myxococcota bacterium]
AAEVARHHDPELALTYTLACDKGRHHVDAVCIVGHKLLRRVAPEPLRFSDAPRRRQWI